MMIKTIAKFAAVSSLLVCTSAFAVQGTYTDTGVVAGSLTETFDFSGDANGKIFGFTVAGAGITGVSFDNLSFDNIGNLFSLHANYLGNSHVLKITGTGNFTYHLGYDSNANYGPGYPVAQVPEPESYAMFLAGLGILGAIARRRKQA